MMPLRRSRDHWVPGRDLHAVRHAPPAPSVEARLDRTPTAVVVGGGIAGLAAATGLAERGVAVTLVEAAPTFFKVAPTDRLSKRKKAERIQPLHNRFAGEDDWRLSAQRRQGRGGGGGTWG